MPTENERKYVLKIDSQPEIVALAERKFRIEQGYVDDMRIRHTDLFNPHDKIYSHNYTFTFKKFTSNRLIEIETSISGRDFYDLWPIATRKLLKYRYKLNGWDIDYFYCGPTCYFSLAEIELPEDKNEPDFIPGFIDRNLAYKVPYGDDRFFNTKLGNVEYCENLYKSLIFRSEHDN